MLTVVPAVLAGAIAPRDPSLDAGTTGLIAGGATLVIAILLLGIRRSATPSALLRPTSAPVEAAAPDDGPPLPPDLQASMAEAVRLAPDRRGELAAIGAACARLLALADRTLDPATHDAAALIRNTLPRLVAHTAALCDGASPIERREHVHAMVASLGELGRSAEVERDRERATLRQSLATVRAHIANRTRRAAL